MFASTEHTLFTGAGGSAFPKGLIVMKEQTVTPVVAPTTTTVVATKEQVLRWKSANTSIDESLGGLTTRNESGTTWTPEKGQEIHPLEKHGNSAFCALVDADGSCTVVLVDVAGMRKPAFSEISASVMEKALAYSGGHIGSDELVIPVRDSASFRTPASPSSPKSSQIMDKRLREHLWRDGEC